jgi:hypothetical protein
LTPLCSEVSSKRNLDFYAEARIGYGLFFIPIDGEDYAMSIDPAINISVESAAWQDYRPPIPPMNRFLRHRPGIGIPCQGDSEELPTELLPNELRNSDIRLLRCGKQIQGCFVKAQITQSAVRNKYVGTIRRFQRPVFSLQGGTVSQNCGREKALYSSSPITPASMRLPAKLCGLKRPILSQ